MFIVTNIETIEAIIEAKKPGPSLTREEFLSKRYGENNITISKSGTVHAAEGGFYDDENETYYKGGEFIPTNGEYASGPRRYDLYAQTPTGERVEWDKLTQGQANAVKEELKKQGDEYRAEISTSIWIGEPRVRLRNLELTISRVLHRVGFYGDEFIHFLSDNDNNSIFYKGSKRLGDDGECVCVDATVKYHNEYKGIKQTIISRPKLK